MRPTRAHAISAFFTGVLLLSAASSALSATPDPAPAFEEARKVAIDGPIAIPLKGLANLQLPQGNAFVPQPQAGKLLQAMGNPGSDPRLLGMIFPKGEDGWFMTVRYEDSGHIKDDDARHWNADDLLKSYKEGTESANEEREKMGAPAMEVLGWSQMPTYDAATHRLVWAMTTRDKGTPADEPQGVNYNTYLLGRESYFTMNLVTSLPDLPAHKTAAHAVLAALSFDDGKRYADYDEKTDRTAEYGLAALVVGLAAKKLGLLALGGVLFAKFAKVILIGLGALGFGATKFFGRGKNKGEVPPAA